MGGGIFLQGAGPPPLAGAGADDDIARFDFRMKSKTYK